MSGIDIESLLTDVSAEAPSGETDLADDPAFIDLEIKMAGTPEREFDGKILQEAKDPNWSEVQEAAVGLLSRAHDLRVIIFLIRALLHTDGFAGLGSGLALLRGFIDRYWESLYPQLDPEDNDDPIQRINILASLSEGEDILGPIKRRSLCVSRSLGQYSFRDILIASGKIEATRNDKTPPPSMVDIEASFKDADVKDLFKKKETLEEALTQLKGVQAALQKKIGDAYSGSVPDFKELHEVLMEMDAIMETQLEGRGSSGANIRGPDADVIVGQPAGAAGVPVGQRMDAIGGRQDVIRLLDQICTYYQHNEPGSPVPILLKRARQLVEKNFIEIIQDLAPDSAGKIKSLIAGEDSNGS